MLRSLLTRVCGPYLNGLEDAELSAFSGTALLKDVSIKPEIVNDLPLPLELISGRVSRVFLKVPWSSLRASPVIVRISGVHVLFRRRRIDGDAASAEEYLSRMETLKVKQLLFAQLSKEFDANGTLEELLASAGGGDGGGAAVAAADKGKQQPSKLSFLERQLLRIVDNVRIELTDLRSVLRCACALASCPLLHRIASERILSLSVTPTQTQPFPHSLPFLALNAPLCAPISISNSASATSTRTLLARELASASAPSSGLSPA